MEGGIEGEGYGEEGDGIHVGGRNVEMMKSLKQMPRTSQSADLRMNRQVLSVQ